MDQWERWLGEQRYSGLSDAEVDAGRQLLAAIRTQLLREAAPGPGQTVLEIGCGAGEFLPGLLQAVGPEGRVEALDLSPGLCAQAEAVRAAHPLGARARVQQGDMRQLPFAPASFDAVFCRAVLQYAGPELPAVAAEIARVLRPGGRCAAFEICTANERPLLPLPRSAAQRRAHARALGAWRHLPHRLSRGGLASAFAPPAFFDCTVSTSVIDWQQPYNPARFAAILEQVPRPGCPPLREVFAAAFGPQERAAWEELLREATHAAQRGAWAYLRAVRA